MNHGILLRLASFALAAGLLVCLPRGGMCADEAGDSFTPSLQSTQEQENLASLNQRLQAAKKDLEVFRTFAEHFSSSGETKTAAQLLGPLNDYLNKHVESLLAKATESSALETTRLAAEIMLIKTRLFMTLNSREAATATVADMKRLFAPYLKITVQVPGKTTTLDEAIRQLDDELTKNATTRK